MNSGIDSPVNSLQDVAELLNKLGIQIPPSFQFQKRGLNIIINLNGPVYVPEEGVDELVRLIHLNTPRQSRGSSEGVMPGPAMAQQDQRLAYSVKEAAKLLGVSQPTIYRLIVRGFIRCTPSLRSKLISKAELDRFLASQ